MNASSSAASVARDAARHEQQVAALDVGERRRAGEHEAAVGLDRARRRAEATITSASGQAVQHRVRAGEVELGQAGEEGFDDAEVAMVGSSAS